MSLINLKNVSVAFGADPILDQANLIIESNERIGLIGRNGAGKSTLLKMIDSKVLPDDGELLIRQGTIVGRLVQEVPSDLDFDIRSVVALGDDTLGQALADYYLAGESDIDTQTIVTELEAWGLDVQVKTLCSRFDLDPEAQFGDLSGGMKRRVLMARALVKQPDILLLDEPTNHLDIETILWLETLLLGLNVTMIIISHDRSFIDKLSTRIIEIDRGLITSYPGNFQTYLATKAKALEDEDVVNAKFDKRLAQEEVWIRKGIQARRTRNEGRVRALKQMRDDRSERRERQGTANISLNAGGGKSGKVVIEAENLRASFDGRVIMRDFSCRILRGDKV
ncbi:MAG: ATP-binding cassette subfamily F protein uup, partial [Arenicella sp.]